MQATESTLAALNSGKLKGVKQLNLEAEDLHTVPEAVFELSDTLEILSLNNNQLTNLPGDLKRLKKLKILFCSNNPFTELPVVLGQCPALEMIGFKACNIKHVPAGSLPPKLRWLILTNNQVETLPNTIGNCQHMQKLMLAGNQLRSIPQSLTQCSNLELLRLSANKFEEVPNWLFNMPKLAWIALAGNPINLSLESSALANNQLRSAKWQHLQLNHLLGEGASGEIYHADWRPRPNQDTPVAVKVFKGEMTSDGLPQSELAAAVAAGSHPNLTSTIGMVEDHPDGQQATIMSLLDPTFKVLAGPPSFASCTRDVYAEDFSLSISSAFNITLQIAKAVEHLHKKGLIHGDLYAHNILLDGSYHALLSDFGGAAFVPHDSSLPLMAQKIEVRAFGILIEELLNHIDMADINEAETHMINKLKTVKTHCLNDKPEARPLMKDITSSLSAKIGMS